MSELLKGMGYTGKMATVHGFRSTFKDWAAEQTNYPNELTEMAMAHTINNKVEAAYRRGDMREKRRRLMEDWAAYCDGVAVGGDNVVAIGGAANEARPKPVMPGANSICIDGGKVGLRSR